MPKQITIRAGDTEPLPFTVGATGVTNLDDVSSAKFYARAVSASENHVDGAPATVADSATMTMAFDPDGAKKGGGNAFDTAGVYRCYAVLTWSDGDETRHPAALDVFSVVVTDNFE